VHVRTKSALRKEPKNEIQTRQGKDLYMVDRLLRFILSADKHKIPHKKKFQAELSCELELSFIVKGATHNRFQGYKAERYPRGEILNKGKGKKEIFNYEYFRHDVFEVIQKKQYKTLNYVMVIYGQSGLRIKERKHFKSSVRQKN
jgi:hypothetical protein